MHFGFVSYLSVSSKNDKLLKQRYIHLIHFSEIKQSQALKTEIDPLYTFLQAPPSIPLLGSQSRPEWVRREAAGQKAATQMRRYLSRNILTCMHAIMLWREITIANQKKISMGSPQELYFVLNCYLKISNCIFCNFLMCCIWVVPWESLL